MQLGASQFIGFVLYLKQLASLFLGAVGGPGTEKTDLSCLSERFGSGGTKTAAFDPIKVYVYPGSLPVPVVA